MDFCKLLNTLSGEVIQSVMPEALLCKCLRLEDGPVKKIVIPPLKLEVEITGRVFVVGFGKGALLLTRGLDKILQGVPIAGAVLSIPEDGSGTIDSSLPPAYRIVKAAPKNYPDENSALAGKLIIDLLCQLTSSDLLIVLITGGGSALVTYPLPPITIDDMASVVEALHKRGAPIGHLNGIRQQFDVLKAGGMAVLSYPARVFSFILSDVIGSDLDVIASGPTSLRRVNRGLSETVKLLEQYNLMDALPANISAVIQDPSSRLSFLRRMSRIPADVTDLTKLDHVSNVLIGSNTDAVVAANAALNRYGIPSVIFEEDVCGDAAKLGERYASLVYYACQCLWSTYKKTSVDSEVMANLGPVAETIISSARLIELPDMKGKLFGVALVSGGETTVVVKGKGKGGRNQEAALAASVAMDKLWTNSDSSKTIASILFLSTDGQDGPTASTGAIATPNVVKLAKINGLDPLASLDNNDSFTFWNELKGPFHICTGRSGTNVADIAVLVAAVAAD